jgi:propionyl-CoA synthetase
VSRLAGGLRERLGVLKGDRVIIYMPMVPEAVVSMLSCTRLGAIHSVVFGGFAAPELANRIRDSGSRVVITCSFGMDGPKRIEYKSIVDEAILLSGMDVKTVVFRRGE